jgi:hypothetical protein
MSLPRLFIFAILMASIMVSCRRAETPVRVVALRSGGHVKILSLTRMFRTDSGETLVLKYRTNLSVSDGPALSREVDAIWADFMSDANRSGVSTAMITALEPARGFLMPSTRGYTFVFRRSVDGVWRRAFTGE